MSEAYWCDALTGGAEGALDAIDGDDLTDKDMAIVVTIDGCYIYHVDADGAGAEASPERILPDDNPGTKVWLLVPMVGYGTIYIDAKDIVPCTTNGCAAIATNEYGANDIDWQYLAFDGAALERAQFKKVMPEDWDLGTIKAKFHWSSAAGSTTADTVEWGLKGGSLSDNDAIDAALGTAQVISDALLNDVGADLQLSGATPAITIGGTPALHDLNTFEVYRNCVAGTDDMVEDAWLFGVLIQYKKKKKVVAW